MMAARKPKPGSQLDNDCDLIVVIERGWSDEKIRASLGQWLGDYGVDGDGGFEYRVATWRYHTAEQEASEGHPGYDAFWSPAGWGSTTIDVAVVSW